MSSLPTVSVIIPVLNEQKRISAAIQHARAMGDCQIIVVDGGSRDDTLNECSEADMVISSQRGRASQQNAGAASATGQLLLFLHADCWLEPAGFHELLQVLEQDAILWGGFEQIIDHDNPRYRVVEKGNAWRARNMGWIYGDQALFVRRNVFEKLGGFPVIPLMEDLYLSKSLKKAGKRRILGRHLHVDARRWERHGIARQTLRNWWFLLRAHLGGSLEQLAREYRDVR